ncbi:MAG: outer membrane lipoprotein-sorting protein [Prolixibacteraceae bacterium]|jgi:outer membrane lipoprotein-sorting protein|nr:outer membrane lipoprotein-sorting protein [Prolixibacteraceae bacterium]
MKNKKYIPSLFIVLMLVVQAFAQPTAKAILDKVDKNMSADNMISESSMTVHGKRNSRTMTSKTYKVGDKQSFTEYLSPAREQGTKMLKLEDKLWIYAPSTDRTIQISGHMLRQSVMGSDMSYEDMMDDRKLTDIYDAVVIAEEMIDERNTYKVEMIANVVDVTYYKRVVWVDSERFVPLKEELFAKSGQLLKQTTLKEVKKIDGRWFPTSMVYKDMMKQGKGTEFNIISVKFNQDIPKYIFTKAALKQ